MQNLIYTGGYSGTNVFNQFQFSAFGPVIRESVFLDVTSSASQVNTGTFGPQFNQGGIYPVDNLARTGNISNFTTLQISPFWRPHFGGYVDGTVRVSYLHVGQGDFNQVPGGPGSFAADSLNQAVNLFNGNRFDLVSWSANLFHSQYLSTAENSSSQLGSAPRFLNYNGRISYRLTEKIQPFVQAGGYDNSFGDNDNVRGARNGAFWNAGLTWTPSRRLMLQAGAGINNYFAAIRATPSRRTELAISYRYSDVGGATPFGIGGVGAGVGGMGAGAGGPFGGVGAGGVGVGASGSGIYQAGLPGACSAGMEGGGAGGGMAAGGLGGFGGAGALGVPMVGMGIPGLGGGFGFPVQGGAFNAGSTVMAAICHRMRRTQLRGSYNEYTITPQDILNSIAVFPQATPAQVQANQPYGIPYYTPNLNGYEIITVRGGQAQVEHNYAKSTYAVTLYQQERSYQISGDQTVWGLTAFWSTRLTRQTNAFLSYAWQSQDNRFVSQPGFTSTLNMIIAGLNHRFVNNVFGGLNYRYITQESDNNPYANYNANTVSANVGIMF
jgi:hypothetical protein